MPKPPSKLRPFGIVTDDLREFRDSPGPDVDAIEGYLMAMRREVLRNRAGSLVTQDPAGTLRASDVGP